MKQKLLLALLALFTSMGMVKAASEITITVPQNSGNLSISISSTKSMANSPTVKQGDTDKTQVIIGTWSATSSKTFTLPNNAGDKSVWTITGGEYTQITVGNGSTTNNGIVTSIDVNHDALAQLTARNCRLGSITFTDASALKNLNVSDNQLKDSNWSLSALSNLTDLNCSNNQLQGTLTVAASVKTLICGGNQLTTVSGGMTNMAVTFGTQTLNTKTDLASSAANQWFDVSTLTGAGGYNVFTEGTTTFSSFKRFVNNTWVTASVKQNPTDKNLYKFQSSSLYESGKYMVTATNSDYRGRTYNIEFIVKPAKFTLQESVDNSNAIGIEVTVSKEAANTPETRDDGAIYAGDVLKITATPKTNYSFSKFETTGIKTPLASGSSIEAEVVGPTPSDDIDKQIVTVKAFHNTASYKLTLGSVAEGGSFKVVDKDDKTITSGSSVPYNTELTLIATAIDKYELDQITVNGAKIDPKDITTNGSISKYTFKMEKSKNIVVSFKVKAGATRTLTSTYDNNICSITINEKSVTNEIEIKEAIKSNTLVIKVSPVSGKSINVKSIMLNNVNADNIVKSNADYTATFTIKAEVTALNLAVVATELATATIAVPQIGTTEDTQTFTYDGSAKPLVYTTTPQGLQFNVTYSTTKGGTYTSTAYTNVGKYFVKYKRNADDKYAAVAEKKYEIIIQKANLTLTQPTVKIETKNGVRSYVITGGSATFNGKTVAGTFVPEAGKATMDFTVPADKTGSHIVALVFVPTATTDKANFKEAKLSASAIENGAALDQYTIKGTLKDGISVKIKNGAAVLATWTSTNTTGINVPREAAITLEFTVPDGIILEKVMKNDANYTDLTLSDKTVTIAAESQAKASVVDFILSTKASAAKKAYTIKEIKTYEPTYTGAVQLYTNTNDDCYTVTGGSNYTASYVYKQNGAIVTSPIEAGTYDVELTVTPTGTDAATMKATTATLKMIVKKAATTIATAPSASKIGKGQTLASSQLTGGSANVVGTFEWADKTIVPDNGSEYQVVFKPTDSKNYESSYQDKDAKMIKVAVEVTNKAIISLASENGTITAKDANGVVYSSGDEVIAGTVLTFTATPAQGYELLTPIKVNGTALSGNTFTMGAVSIAVTADFTMKPFTVTTTTSVKGVIITLPASNKVKKGESYEFTLAHLAADKPVVKDGATVIAGVNGKYTISNVQSDKNISITLANPTAISVKGEPTLSPGNKEMGKIEFKGLTDGKCFYGDEVTATATPVPNVKFAGWEGLTSIENPLKMIVKEAITLKANYTGSPVGIESIEGMKLEGGLGHIFVSCDGTATLTIVSMNGQSAQIEVSGETRIERAAGVYGVVLQQGSVVLKTKVVVR